MDLTAINPQAAALPAPAQNAVPPEVAEDRRVLIRAVKAVNQSELYGSENELSFSVDRATKRPVVKIVDRKTHEVVQQIPNEHVLRMAEELYQQG
ncbi:MAG: flagellar protein FlaG [Acidobacteriota bacterium]